MHKPFSNLISKAAGFLHELVNDKAKNNALFLSLYIFLINYPSLLRNSFPPCFPPSHDFP